MIKPFVEKLLLRAVRNNQETRQRLLVVLAQPDKKPNSLLLISKLGSLKAYLRDIAEFVEDIGDLLPGLLQECDVPPGIVRLVENTVVSFKDWRLQVGDKWQGVAEQDHELARLMRRPGQVAPTQPAF